MISSRAYSFRIIFLELERRPLFGVMFLSTEEQGNILSLMYKMENTRFVPRAYEYLHVLDVRDV